MQKDNTNYAVFAHNFGNISKKVLLVDFVEVGRVIYGKREIVCA